MAKKPPDILGTVLSDFAKDKKPQDIYAQKVDKWYRAYRGIFEQRSKASSWTSQLHPPYAFQVIETLTANVVDPNPRWAVKPCARMASRQEVEMLTDGAKANEILLREQVELDHFAMKQMAFAKQAFIASMSVFKVFWNYAERDVPRQTVRHVEQDGILIPTLGMSSEKKAVKDDWTAEVVDVRDWFPHEGAISLDNALRVTHRCWYTFDELKRLEAQGVYGEKAGGQPVDLLGESRDFNAEASSREQDLFDTDRTKDKVEVLEQWRVEPDGSIRVVSVGNRGVLLRDVPDPLMLGRLPFVVCSPIPDLQRLPGISAVELIADLQEAKWSFLNQRIDNTELLNNAVVLIREDVDDLEQFEWAPGAQWVVQDPQQVSLLQVNPLPAEISIQAEEKLMDDLQNIPGASPTLLGQSDPKNNTATEISLSTSLAQRRIALMKHQFRWAYKTVGEIGLALNQRFIRKERLVQRIGPDGAAAWEAINPLILQGDYYIEIDSMDESLMRQERRAEVQAKLQVALNAAQYFAALPGQPGLNLKSFMDDYLEEFGASNTERYYSAVPQEQAQLGGQGGQEQGGQPQQGGLTAPQAHNATSPSNAVSLSPMAATQRLRSMSGGPVNT